MTEFEWFNVAYRAGILLLAVYAAVKGHATWARLSAVPDHDPTVRAVKARGLKMVKVLTGQSILFAAVLAVSFTSPPSQQAFTLSTMLIYAGFAGVVAANVWAIEGQRELLGV